MSENVHISGKTIVISGAASGLGAGFAERFLKEGAKHVAILDVAVEAGESTARRLREQFGAERVSFTRCDVTDERLLIESFEALVNRLKTIDVMVNNAGILNDHPRVYRRANDVNWQALTTLSTLAWAHMRTDKGGGGGTIANISSVAALAQWPWLPIYSGAKAAVLHFSCCLGMEPNYSRTKVRVMCMTYGQTETPLMQDVRVKCMDDAMGQGFHEQEQGMEYQSVAAAVEAMQTMLEQGESGSCWLAVHGRPVKDISKYLAAGYAEIARALMD